jgi:hypothetical protein
MHSQRPRTIRRCTFAQRCSQECKEVCCAGGKGSALVCSGPKCRADLRSVRLTSCTLVVASGAQASCTHCSSAASSPAFLTSGSGSRLTVSRLAVRSGACAVSSGDGGCVSVQGASVRDCSNCAFVVAHAGDMEVTGADVSGCRTGVLPRNFTGLCPSTRLAVRRYCRSL